MRRVVRALWGGCCLAVMHVLPVPPVDNADHPAVRHLTSAVGTALSGSVVTGVSPGVRPTRHMEPAGHELGDDPVCEGTAGLRGYGGAAGSHA